ncbi:hypothetical protein FV232_03745 [Methylobacterium sp. WL30]|nr:hypothetical protein FV232_03745 [Methylobacterium sp. WL30]
MMPSRAAASLRRSSIVAAAAFAIVLPGALSASAESCRAAVGARQAERLVERCMSVSPATHPPCNADNACALIESEIARGCGMIDDGTAPSFCRDD